MNPFDVVPVIFVLVPLFFVAMFVIVTGVFLFVLARGVAEWAHNNSLPVLSVPAQIVAKRTRVTQSSMPNGDFVQHTTDTDYYITFELDSSERKEFWVSDREYGSLVEGDRGVLRYQGTRYHGFQRR